MKKVFICFLLATFQFTLMAIPYFSEYHENGYIIIFSGEISESDIPQIKALERQYLEEMNTLIYQSTNIPDNLEKLGVKIGVIQDSPHVLPKGHPVIPRTK